MEDAEAASGVAMILLDASRQNRIVVIGGANMRCDDAQVDAVASALEGADALMLQCEIPPATSLKAARIAREMGVRVVWDPSPAEGFPPEAYAVVDVLTPNQAEAAALTGIDVTDAASAEAAARAIVERGVRAVVVKMGEGGAFYLSDGEGGYVLPNEVEAVDTVAAGDAFGAAMTCALAEGKSMVEAVRYGAAAGALAVTRPGAQEAMPSQNGSGVAPLHWLGRHSYPTPLRTQCPHPQERGLTPSLHPRSTLSLTLPLRPTPALPL